jgi:hypothetical protein
VSEYQIEALPVEAQQRILALREAKSLLTRRQSAPSGSPFGLTREVEAEIGPVDLVTIASWIVTGNDPRDSVPAREQVELEAQAEAFLAPVDDEVKPPRPGPSWLEPDTSVGPTEYEDESDPEPSPTEARIGDYVNRTVDMGGYHVPPLVDEFLPRETVHQNLEAIARAWSPGPLDSTETIPAVPAEPTFDEVLGRSDQADREAWS